MLIYGDIYKDFSSILRSRIKETDGGTGRKDFFTESLALLVRCILGYLDHQKYLFIDNGDGTRSPAACVTLHHYLPSEPPHRLEKTAGERTFRTFCLKHDWETLDAIPPGGYFEYREPSYYESLVANYLEDDALIRLVECLDGSLAAMDDKNFFPGRFLSGKARRERVDNYYLVPEEVFRKDPKLMPGYLYSRFRSARKELGRTNSYTRFLRAASCMETDGKEAVFRNWEKSEAARDWERRHRGRSFTHMIIPVTDVRKDLVVVIELFALFPPSVADPNIADVKRTIAEESRLCVSEILRYQMADEYRESALQYALSSVMTRNMSHNIGSHVYTRLTNPSAETFAVKKDGGPYHGMFDMDQDKELDANHQISYLNSYIRHRMDFISDVSYRRPSALSTWNLRGDIMKELDRTRLLLNHISGLEENFPFSFKVVNHVAKVSPDAMEGKDDAARENLRKEALDSDLQVSVPNSIIGWHALYNIIENVIRNVAKHGDSNLEENVFTLELSEDSGHPHLYDVLLYHNKPMETADADKLVESINQKIDAPVLSGRQLRPGDLGVVEMKASAAILRQMDSLCAVLPGYHADPPILKAVKVEIPGGDGKTAFWGYRFYMLRPQDCLSIVPDGTNLTESGMTLGDLSSALSEGEIIGHDFLVYDDSLEESIRGLVKVFRTALPMRLIPLSALEGNSPDERRNCWIAWEKMHRDDWKTRIFRNSDSGLDKVTAPSAYAVILSHDKDGAGKSVDLKNLAGRHSSVPEHIYFESLSSLGEAMLPFEHDYGILTDYVGMLSNTGNYIKTPPSSAQERKDLAVFSEVLEAVNSSVFILDERIQEAARKQSYLNAPLYQLMELSGISIPGPEYDLQAQAMTMAQCDSLLSMIGEAVRNNDFVVLHYGLLERIFKKKETSKENWLMLLTSQIEKWQSVPGAAEIVVESGRGVPKNLPPTVRFLSSSAIYSAAVEVRSKVMLDKILYTSRKVNIS